MSADEADKRVDRLEALVKLQLCDCVVTETTLYRGAHCPFHRSPLLFGDRIAQDQRQWIAQAEGKT